MILEEEHLAENGNRISGLSVLGLSGSQFALIVVSFTLRYLQYRNGLCR